MNSHLLNSHAYSVPLHLSTYSTCLSQILPLSALGLDAEGDGLLQKYQAFLKWWLLSKFPLAKSRARCSLSLLSPPNKIPKNIFFTNKTNHENDLLWHDPILSWILILGLEK